MVEEIVSVKITVGEEEAIKKAQKYQRPRNFWQTAKGIGFGNAEIMKSIGAIYFLLFPITYPLFQFFGKKYDLEWVRLVFWPYYKTKVQISGMQGLNNIELWVEGMTDGLSQGNYDPVVRGERFFYMETSSDPFYFSPHEKKRESKTIVSMIPPKKSVILPFSINENTIANYIINDLAEKGALGDSNTLRGLKVLQIERVYYPLWVVKYSHRNSESLMTLGAENKKAFHRMNISTPVSLNRNLSDLTK